MQQAELVVLDDALRRRNNEAHRSIGNTAVGPVIITRQSKKAMVVMAFFTVSSWALSTCR